MITKENIRTPEETVKRKEKILKQIINDTIFKALFIIAICFVAFSFFFGVTTIKTNDMYPAIREGDIVIYYRLSEPMNSDVVLYHADNKLNIGRIQATEGSVIDKTRGDILTIDGNMQPIQERSGIYNETIAHEESILRYPSKVPSSNYLILGDNRQEAIDSRTYGYIKKTNIKGKIFTIIRRRFI